MEKRAAVKRRISIILTLVGIVVALLLFVPKRALAPTPTLPLATATLPYVSPTPSATATATTTQTPSTTPSPTSTPPAVATHPAATSTPAPLPDAPGEDAQVQEGWVALNLRTAPGTAGEVLGTLAGGARLSVVGKADDASWVEVVTEDDQVGWVKAEHLDMYVDLAGVQVTGEVVNVEDIANTGAVTGVTSTARQIYQRGRQLGNRGNVFSKVGDSITKTEYFMYPFGWGRYDLGQYGYLQDVIGFFSSTIARGQDTSFHNNPLAAGGGWIAADPLDPKMAEPPCRAGEMPLLCEYRLVRPAVAIIMLGSNDSGGLPVEDFAANLRRIAALSIENGVIPVLTTIPPRRGTPADHRVPAFNTAITGIAQEYGIPLIDYWSALQGLPNQGISEDGVHPSRPEFDPASAADFTEGGLQYGFNVRNLLTLQMLDTLWRNVLYDYAPGAAPPAPAPAPSDPISAPDPAQAPSTQQPPTSAPPAPDACTHAPPVRLAVGGRGRVVVTVNVRAQPHPDAQDVGDVRQGETFTVAEGPVCADGLRWWRIASERASGWAASGWGSEYWLEPG